MAGLNQSQSSNLSKCALCRVEEALSMIIKDKENAGEQPLEPPICDVAFRDGVFVVREDSTV
jgi:hypothetical protein